MYVNVIKNYVEAIIKCRYRLTKTKKQKKTSKKKKKNIVLVTIKTNIYSILTEGQHGDISLVLL
jgi:hypothetical protein